MKKVFIAISIVGVLASCQNIDGYLKNDKKNEVKEEEKKSTTVSLNPIPQGVLGAW